MAYGENKEAMASMIKSLFTYGGLSKDSSYLDPYKKALSKEEFDEVYDTTVKDLQDNYEIIHGVYTDSEGCTYNQLVKKKPQVSRISS